MLNNIPPPDTTANNAGATGGLVGNAKRCYLYGIYCYNGSGAPAYLQFFDAAAVPANTTAALMSVQVAAGATASIVFAAPRPMANGVAVALSSTAATLTQVDSLNSLLDCHTRQRN
jgi:hypothetical protein